MKKICVCLLLLVIAFSAFTFTGCGSDKVQEFYDLVSDSQDYLDDLADAIYSNWYDAIYDDAYGGSINLAIYYAQSEYEYEINLLKSNDIRISNLYKEVRDSKLSDEIKEVMTAYSDYYEFVVNVSGSFKTFSANKETYKKELASALHSLYMEL